MRRIWVAANGQCTILARASAAARRLKKAKRIFPYVPPERSLYPLIGVLVFVAAMSGVFALNTDYGRIDVRMISIPDGDLQLGGFLYRPNTATGQSPRPGIIIAHGIASSKQIMSGIALELARRGFVTLAIDLVGHGNSGGSLESAKDLSLGTSAAIQYLKSQPYVNASDIALVGHSLGAGAIRAAAAASDQSIIATVFIAGGFGSTVADPAYGILTTEFPRNLLVIVGQYDSLFDLPQLETEILPPVFGTPDPVIPGMLYGSFSDQTARKLVTPDTTHLLEPLDPTAISEIDSWMENAFFRDSTQSARELGPDFPLDYKLRDTGVALSLLTLVGTLLPISSVPLHSSRIGVFPEEGMPLPRYGRLEDWKVFAIWGGLSLLLLAPTFLFGLLVSFPPLLFGGSLAWWTLSVGVFGLVLLRFVQPDASAMKLDLREALTESFRRREAIVGIGLVVGLYVVACLYESFLSLDLGIIAPLLKPFGSLQRVLMMPVFLPFFLVYFFAEGMYLHRLRSQRLAGTKPQFGIRHLLKTVAIKTVPFLALLVLQYVPIVFFGVKPFSGSFGLLFEFFGLITALFAITTVCSWWFYRSTSRIGLGVVFNALLIAWIASIAFPF